MLCDTSGTEHQRQRTGFDAIETVILPHESYCNMKRRDSLMRSSKFSLYKQIIQTCQKFCHFVYLFLNGF